MITTIFGPKLGPHSQVSLQYFFRENPIILYSILGTDGEYFPACPVAGEYTGKLTDNPELCAKLYSDCNKLDIMYFLVTPCHNSTQVIEGKTIQILVF